MNDFGIKACAGNRPIILKAHGYLLFLKFRCRSSRCVFKENNNHDFYDLNKKDMFHEEHDIDISDPKIKMLLSDHDFEIIFHLAAQPLVRDSYSSQKEHLILIHSGH